MSSVRKDSIISNIFPADRLDERDRARSVCANNNATLSLPENQKESDFIAAFSTKHNISETHAADGQTSPRCAARVYKAMKENRDFNSSAVKGECNLNNRYFLFDNANTDPAFVFAKFSYPPPNQFGSFWSANEPKVYHFAACLAYSPQFNPTNATNPGYANTSYCVGRPIGKVDSEHDFASGQQEIKSVICGRHPL
ncbi:Protein CBG13463 [Caenorhabditis briggsae]|uniref:Protein CBG13463 n=1 Tax=Caenorhabditis briggsae TaxID=6238 RepID=A8XHP7_CAEBR|nr:Protein CBG13463 [Caenorhabditis briggsae]CAP32164.2 Protein CBG13463 [Caenorhabditis briggsae]